MHYSYLLFSEVDRRLHKGTTGDLRKGSQQHAAGRVRSTAYGRHLRLICYDAFLPAGDTYRRERYLETGRRKRYLGQRLVWLSEPDRTSWSGTSPRKRAQV